MEKIVYSAANRGKPLTDAQKEQIRLAVNEYYNDLLTLDERYKEAFYEFRKFVCGS